MCQHMRFVHQVIGRSIRVLHRILTEYLHKAFFRPSGIFQPAVHIEVAELQLLLRERFLFRLSCVFVILSDIGSSFLF